MANLQRKLGALNFLPEHPFDRPHGFIDEATTRGIKAFQRAQGLADDGWLAPGGETETALDDAIFDLARAGGRDWLAFAERAGRAQQALIKKFDLRNGGAGPTDDDEDDGGDARITLVRTPPTITPRPGPYLPGGPGRSLPPFGPRRLLEIDPRFVPRHDWRKPVQMPPNPQIVDPAARPSPMLPGPVQPPPRRPWVPPTIADIENVTRKTPTPDPDTTVTYLPEPGSRLAIPILDQNPHGRPGNPLTKADTRSLAKAIEDGCRRAMKDAKVEHFAGPGSRDLSERGVPGEEGYAFPDSWTRISYKGVEIYIFGDTYTPKADRMPTTGEQMRFMRLDRNAADFNRIYVRMPKSWMTGQQINLKNLRRFARELCEEVKRAVDEGRIGDGKDKLRQERFFEDLIKAKEPSAPPPKKAAPGRHRPRP